MKKVIRAVLVLLAAVILLGVGALLVQRQTRTSSAEVVAPTAVATRGSIEETVSASGNVAANQEATLTFASSGQIDQVLVEEGQQVKAEQVLARLDTGSLEWQIARAQASLNTAQARLEQAQKPATAEDLASAQAALDSAQANYDNIREGATAEDLASAQAALDSAKANYDKVKAGPTKEDLAAAQASVDSARASLQQAQAAYDRVKDRPNVAMLQESLTLQNATIEYNRAKANYDAAANHPTASELASARAQVVQAEAQLAQLQARPTASELASAESQVAQAQAQLDQLKARPNAEDVAVSQAQMDEAAIALAQAQAQLDDAVITAPFDGTILTVRVNDGEWASPGSPAIVLAATETLALDVNVDEVDVAALAEGQTAYLSFDALKGGNATGTVTRIAPSSTNVSGAVAYPVEISFDPGQLPVRLGMTANVDVVVASAEGALLVPNRAIETDRAAGLYYVTRQLAGGSIQRLEVRIGLRDENNTQILEGLDEGDQVVLPELPSQSTGSTGFSGPFGGGGALKAGQAGGGQ
jgi:HlyD family secretion protein